jgi:hypothetical protein
MNSVINSGRGVNMRNSNIQRDRMLSSLFLTTLLCFISVCSNDKTDAKRIRENGIAVIINRNEPNITEGKTEVLSLNEDFIIDLEADDLATLGLTDVWGFDVDSNRNIYFFKNPTSEGDLVYKFDPTGRFISSFAPRGQGPGEVQMPSFQKFNARDELPITDSGINMIKMFDTEGAIVKTIDIGVHIGFMGNMVYPLENGNYLIRRSLRGELEEKHYFVLSLFDTEFNAIKELDRFEVVQPIRADKVRLPMHVSVWCVSGNRIYVGNEDNGYEIHVYDFVGNPVRKIRKVYQPTPVSNAFKHYVNGQIKDTPPVFKKKIYFPEHFPPFQCIFIDDRDYLYVMTFEKGTEPGEHRVDIFDPEGVLVGKTGLDIYLSDPFFTPGVPLDSWVTMRDNRLYTLRMKDSGYKEFVAYHTFWE